MALREVPVVEGSIRMEHEEDCCCRYVLVPSGAYETKLIDTRCIAAYLVPDLAATPAPDGGSTDE